jgi:hypothetical protein
VDIAILGGAGRLGLALALRLSQSGHNVMIGSRDAARAAEAVQKANVKAIVGTNESAASWCEGALITVPYSAHRVLLSSLREALRGKVVIDTTVPLDPANPAQIKTESGKSAAEEAAAMLSEANVFAAFQTISHRSLRQAEASPDVLVAGGDRRKDDVMDLIRSMKLNPVDAGPIEAAGHIERVTALLLSINKANKVKESGIKITGI